MNLIIGLDCDGVILNPHPLRAIVAKELYNLEIDPVLLQESRFMEAGLTREMYDRIKKQVYAGNYTPGFVQGVLESIRELVKIGSVVKVVTARQGDFLAKAENQLRESTPGISLPFVGTGYKESKVEHCRDCHVYVDDDMEKLVPLIGIVPHLFFFVWPWNEHEEIPEGIIPVSNWPAIMWHIKQIPV